MSGRKGGRSLLLFALLCGQDPNFQLWQIFHLEPLQDEPSPGEGPGWPNPFSGSPDFGAPEPMVTISAISLSPPRGGLVTGVGGPA